MRWNKSQKATDLIRSLSSGHKSIQKDYKIALILEIQIDLPANI
jgi:hypothetical protein